MARKLGNHFEILRQSREAQQEHFTATNRVHKLLRPKSQTARTNDDKSLDELKHHYSHMFTHATRELSTLTSAIAHMNKFLKRKHAKLMKEFKTHQHNQSLLASLSSSASASASASVSSPSSSSSSTSSSSPSKAKSKSSSSKGQSYSQHKNSHGKRERESEGASSSSSSKKQKSKHGKTSKSKHKHKHKHKHTHTNHSDSNDKYSHEDQETEEGTKHGTAEAAAANLDSDKHSPHETSRSDLGVGITKGNIWSHDDFELPPDSDVAAFVNDTWLQAKVVGIRSGNNAGNNNDNGRLRYEVQDADTGDGTSMINVRAKTYVVDSHKIIPLPSLTVYPINKRKVFSRNTRVLAIYPTTTTLYPASVSEQPKKRGDASSMYKLVFDDDDERETMVSAQLVCPFVTLY